MGEIIEEKNADIDVTPMLDVVFIMLIFFIVTATFVNEKGLDLPTMAQRSEHTETKENILVQIMADDKTVINGRDVDIRRLVANVQRLKTEIPHAKVIIQASKRSKNDTLVKVMDGIKLAGVRDLSFADSIE